MAAPQVDDAAIGARLDAGLATLGQTASAEQREQLLHFLKLLVKWNQAFNLTAVRDPLEMVTRHLLDSLAVRPALLGERVLDVGTGAGLPGLPLAVMETGRHFALLDSVGKKTRFLRHAVAELALADVEVCQTRVEAYQPEALYDTVVCRAFSSLGDFVSACDGLVAARGRMLAMKGRFPEEEMKYLPQGWQAVCKPLAVPGLDGQRHLVTVTRTTGAG